ncbi:MAG: ribonuclease III [Myxococcales bacterium]|nr:ribonuclease III [Myxococcales bacterium]
MRQLPDHGEPVADEVAGELETLAPLGERLGHAFHRPALLRVALTLGSWCNEHQDAGWPSNACLEFYGDAVLDLLAADALWRRFPNLAEGTLTRLRASLVSEDALSEVAREIGLGDWLFLGRGDELRGIREQSGALADALEAVIGAVHLDARAAGDDPLRAAEQLFERWFGARVRALEPEDGLDAKSRLQHAIQARHRRTPAYEVVGERPPPGSPHWRARVVLERPDGARVVLGEGAGRSLREAERAAARAALTRKDLDDPR